MSKNGEDFGPVSRIQPDAVGVPGSRRFRLLVEGSPGAACLWLEKEQLQALGLAIEQLLAPLATIWTSNPPEPPPQGSSAGFPAQPRIEFQVSRLALGFDEGNQQFLLLVHDADADQEGPATLTCRATRPQLKALGQAISGLVSAGRPRCPLCGQPIEGPQHVCAGSNGHTSHE
jgi:uncharacterized repeat protein (TIGR03847 family)